MFQNPQGKPFLRLDHVNFSYYSNLGEVKVLNDINFSIEKGAFAALVGPSGCGKSTTPLTNSKLAQTCKWLYYILF